jgi:hypothetical protein
LTCSTESGRTVRQKLTFFSRGLFVEPVSPILSSSSKTSSRPSAVAEPEATLKLSRRPRLCRQLVRAMRIDSTEPEKEGPRIATERSIVASWRPAISSRASRKVSF